MNVDLFQWFINFFDKKTAGETGVNEIISNKELAEALYKLIIRKIEKKIFIRKLKNRIYKYMTLISKNVHIDKLDDIFNKYINTYHSTIK